MSEENKALARRSWESVDNPDVLEEVYAPEVVWHDPDRGTILTETSRAWKKPGSLSPCSSPPSPT